MAKLKIEVGTTLTYLSRRSWTDERGVRQWDCCLYRAVVTDVTRAMGVAEVTSVIGRCVRNPKAREESWLDVGGKIGFNVRFTREGLDPDMMFDAKEDDDGR